MTEITHEALEALTNPRQALEEAYEAIHGETRRVALQDPRWPHWARFTRFLDAEAWTDAAVMLVPEGKCWHIRYDPRLTGATVMDQDGFNQHHTLAETPALALAQACLKARENSDG